MFNGTHTICVVYGATSHLKIIFTQCSISSRLEKPSSTILRMPTTLLQAKMVQNNRAMKRGEKAQIYPIQTLVGRKMRFCHTLLLVFTLPRMLCYFTLFNSFVCLSILTSVRTHDSILFIRWIQTVDDGLKIITVTYIYHTSHVRTHEKKTYTHTTTTTTCNVHKFSEYRIHR